MLALFPGTRVSVSNLQALLFGLGDLLDTDLGATGCKKKKKKAKSSTETSLCFRC